MNKLVIPPSPNWYATNAIACTPDNTLIYGARNDLVVLKAKSTSETSDVHIISKAHSMKVVSVNCNKNWGQPNKFVVTSAEDKIIKLWDVGRMKKKLAHDGHLAYDKIAGAAFAGDERIISVSESGVIIVWNISQNEQNVIKDLFGPNRVTINCMSICPHANWVTAFGLRNGLVVITDLRKNGKVLYKLRGHDREVTCLAWCPVPINIFPKNPKNIVSTKKPTEVDARKISESNDKSPEKEVEFKSVDNGQNGEGEVGLYQHVVETRQLDIRIDPIAQITPLRNKEHPLLNVYESSAEFIRLKNKVLGMNDGKEEPDKPDSFVGTKSEVGEVLTSLSELEEGVEITEEENPMNAEKKGDIKLKEEEKAKITENNEDPSKDVKEAIESNKEQISKDSKLEEKTENEAVKEKDSEGIEEGAVGTNKEEKSKVEGKHVSSSELQKEPKGKPHNKEESDVKTADGSKKPKDLKYEDIAKSDKEETSKDVISSKLQKEPKEKPLNKNLNVETADGSKQPKDVKEEKTVKPNKMLPNKEDPNMKTADGSQKPKDIQKEETVRPNKEETSEYVTGLKLQKEPKEKPLNKEDPTEESADGGKQPKVVKDEETVKPNKETLKDVSSSKLQKKPKEKPLNKEDPNIKTAHGSKKPKDVKEKETVRSNKEETSTDVSTSKIQKEPKEKPLNKEEPNMKTADGSQKPKDIRKEETAKPNKEETTKVVDKDAKSEDIKDEAPADSNVEEKPMATEKDHKVSGSEKKPRDRRHWSKKKSTKKEPREANIKNLPTEEEEENVQKTNKDINREIPRSEPEHEAPRKEFLLASSAKDSYIYIWRAGTDGRMQTFLKTGQKVHGSQRAPAHHTKEWTSICWPTPTQLLATNRFADLLEFIMPRPLDGIQQRTIHKDHSNLIFNIVSPLKLFDENNWNDVVHTNAWTSGIDRMLLNTSLDADRKNLHCYPTNGGTITRFALSPIDPNRLAIGNAEGILKLWDLGREHTAAVRVSRIHQKIRGKITTLAWHPANETTLAIGTAEGRVGLLDVAGKNKVPELFGHYFKTEIYRLEWGPVGGDAGDLGLYAVAEGKLAVHSAKDIKKDPVEIEAPDDAFIYSFSWKPDYAHLLVSTKTGMLYVYSADLRITSTNFLISCSFPVPSGTIYEAGRVHLNYFL